MIDVTAAIIEKEGKILIARRRKGKHLAGFWELPGGKIEGNESSEECLKRELYEEFNVSADVNDFVCESIHDYPTKKIRLLAYRVLIEETILSSIDHDRIEWIDPMDFIQYKIAPADIPILVYYANESNSLGKV